MSTKTLGSVFTDVLKAKAKDAEVFNYNDIGDFSKLWRKDVSDCGKPVIIVWDGVGQISGTDDVKAASPGDGMLVRHMTPLDWALAFSIRALDNGKGQTNSANPPRIQIIDLSGRVHDSWALRMRHQLLAEMPWVTLHAPLQIGERRSRYMHIIPPDGAGAADNNSLFIQSEANGLTHNPERQASNSNPSQVMELKKLARQWPAALDQTRDHHDLNNILGPDIITKWLRNSRSPTPVDETAIDKLTTAQAFIIRQEWMGMLQSGDGKDDPIDTVSATSLDVLAIDDEIRNGWDEVLKHLTKIYTSPSTSTEGAENSIFQIAISPDLKRKLYGCKDPHGLLRCLGMNVESKPVNTDCYTVRNFDSPIPASTGPWLMVLDLHLFSGEEEQQWIQCLADIARALVDVSGLAWKGFSLQEIEAVIKWCSSPGSGSGYDTALSLFPRLCALRWPGVPILVFSATGRRTLVSKLAAYGNIFLASAKPNVFVGDSSDQIGVFSDSFRREYNSAMGLISLQEQLITLQKRSVERPVRGSDGKCKLYRHLTIAIDESGNFHDDSCSSIGGVVVDVEGSSPNDAQANSFRFFEKLREKGVNFYDHPPAYTELKEIGKFDSKWRIISKDSAISKEVAQVLTGTMAEIGAFRCVLPKEIYYKKNESSDGVYLKWLGTTLELLLAEYLDSVGYNLESTKLSIWLPTRSTSGGSEDAAMALDQSFHYAKDKNGRSTLMTETIGGHSVGYSLLANALAGRRRGDEILKVVKGIKVRKIPYYKDGSYKSAIHWYCKDCNKYAGVPKNNDKRVPDRGNLKKVPVKPSDAKDLSYSYCNRHPDVFLGADYSVAAHLADASLDNAPDIFPNDELGADNIVFDRSFDVLADECLSDFLQTCRLFDSDREGDGFKLACKHAFFASGLNSRTSEKVKAPLELRLIEELKEHSQRVDGNMIIELAGLSLRAGQQLTPSAQARGQKNNLGDQRESHDQKLVQIRILLMSGSTAPEDALKTIATLIPEEIANLLIRSVMSRSAAKKTIQWTLTLADGADGREVSKVLRSVESPRRFWQTVIYP